MFANLSRNNEQIEKIWHILGTDIYEFVQFCHLQSYALS